MRKIDLHREIIKSRNDLRVKLNGHRDKAKAFKERVARDLADAPTAMAEILCGTAVPVSATSSTHTNNNDSVGLQEEKADPAVVVPKTKKRKAATKRKAKYNFEVLKQARYDVEDYVLAAFVVDEVKQYYAGIIQSYNADTSLYTVSFLDGTTSDSVSLDDILCYEWFRKGMQVYAPVKGNVRCYEATVLSTNYYSEEGDIIDLDGEYAEMDVKFTRDNIVEEEVYIFGAFIRL